MAKKECDIWLSNDYLCTRWTWWQDVANNNCVKIVRNSWIKHKDEIKGFDRFYIFKPRPTSEDVVNFEDEGLAYCSSIPSAIDFSIQCGFKKIFLLGADHKLDEKTGYHHFWQFFPRNKQPKQLKPAQGNWSVQKKVFEYNGLAYRALQKFAIYKKCKIYNCNKDSNVNEFDKIDFNTMKGYII